MTDTPEQIQTPSQYPTATRIENGVAYDISGKALGSMNDQDPAAQEQKGDDFFAQLGAKPVQQQSAQEPKDDDFFTQLGGKTVQQDTEKPGMLSKFWSAINKPVGDFFLPEGIKTEDIIKAYAFHNLGLGQYIPGVNDEHTIQQEVQRKGDTGEDSPRKTAIKTFLVGAGADTAGVGASFTSPLSIATFSVGAAGKIPGAVGTIARATTGLASAGFTAQGVKDMIDSGMSLSDVQKAMHLEGDPEKFQKFLQGAGIAVLGGTGAYESRGAFRSTKQAFDVASKVHESTQKVFDARMSEVDIATKQAEQAATQAQQARQNESSGTGTRQQTIEAEENSSAAAANARKAQQALKEAGEARASAGMERDRLQRKINKAQMKVSAKQTQDTASVYGDMSKVAPSAPHGPASYDDADAKIVRSYIEDHHENIQPIRSKQDLFDALDTTQKNMENQIKPYVNKYAFEPIATDVVRDVRDNLAGSPQADFIEDGMNHLLKKYPQLEETPNVYEAEKIRADLNSINRGELNSKWGRRLDDALTGDPEFAARYYAAESLRNGIYNTFEEKGVAGIRELRQDESSVIRYRNAVERSGLAKGAAKIRGSGESNAWRKAAAWATQKGSTLAGAKLLGAPGAVAGDMIGEKLGKRWNPGDLTQDKMVERMMKHKVADIPITEIVGQGQPSTAGPREIGLSPKDMQHIQREYGPLHAELATHYGESVGNSTYSDLEKRFMEDLQDKQLHGVALEAPEKALLKQINQQNASDLLKTRQVQQDQAISGKQIGKYTLPDRVEPVLEAPGQLANHMHTREALVHDLAHVVVGTERGLSFEDGIRSHLHSANAGTERVMTAPINFEDFINDEGDIDFNRLTQNLPDLVATYVAGGVANDLYHDIPFTENHALGADYRVMKSFMKKAGLSEAEAAKMIAQAAQDAATILSRPGMREILEGHAALREAGLHEKYHFSPERLEQVLQDVKEGTQRETTTGKSSGANANGNRAASKPGTGKERAAKNESSEGVREEGNRGKEGQAEGVRESNESSSPAATGGTGTTKSNDPAFSAKRDLTQGGHAGGGVASEEELARPGHFVKIGRSGNATYQAKTPDFNLGQGEAGYRVERGKAPQLWAGQETPTTKSGVGRYTKEVFGDEASPAFSAHKPGVPAERSTGSKEFDDVIKAGGGIPGGLQKGDSEIGIPDMALFHDPTSGSTLTLPVEPWHGWPALSRDAVVEALKKSREAYAAGELKNKAYAEAAKGDVSTAADEYNRRQGRDKINTETHPHDTSFAKRTADAYEQMQHNPADPKTKAAYDAMKKDVDKQWDYATNDMGMKFEPWKKEGQPYANSKEMVEDVKNNKHLYFFQGGESPVDNPLQQIDPKTGLSYNDKFRAVHDLFGHAAQGNQFGPKGEETAYQLHRQMFSPEAVPALTSETRGQNSWVNYGKHLRNAEGKIPAKGEQGFIPAAQRPYAQQKTGLLPEEFHGTGPSHWSEKVASNLDKQPAGGINPLIPEAPSKRYGFEILPEARQALEQNPTAEHFQNYAAQHAKEIASHPDIKLGWDTTGPKPELNIGAATDDLGTAKQLAAKLDQRSLWDNKEGKVIPVGGNGEKTSFPEYPFEQRLQDLDPAFSEKAASKVIEKLEKSSEKYARPIPYQSTGEFTNRTAPSMIFSDGRITPAMLTHADIASEAGFENSIKGVEDFQRKTGALRVIYPEFKTYAGEQSIGAEVHQAPTDAQMRILAHTLASAEAQGVGNGNLVWDVYTKQGKPVSGHGSMGSFMRAVDGVFNKRADLSPAFAKTDLINVEKMSGQQLIDKAKETYPHTDDVEKAKYILPDGTMISEPEDHSDIAHIMSQKTQDKVKNSSDLGTQIFLKKTGAMRVNKDAYYAGGKGGVYIHIDPRTELTPIQLEKARELIGKNRTAEIAIEKRAGYETDAPKSDTLIKFAPSISEVNEFLSSKKDDSSPAFAAEPSRKKALSKYEKAVDKNFESEEGAQDLWENWKAAQPFTAHKDGFLNIGDTHEAAFAEHHFNGKVPEGYNDYEKLANQWGDEEHLRGWAAKDGSRMFLWDNLKDILEDDTDTKWPALKPTLKELQKRGMASPETKLWDNGGEDYLGTLKELGLLEKGKDDLSPAFAASGRGKILLKEALDKFGTGRNGGYVLEDGKILGTEQHQDVHELPSLKHHEESEDAVHDFVNSTGALRVAPYENMGEWAQIPYGKSLSDAQKSYIAKLANSKPEKFALETVGPNKKFASEILDSPSVGDVLRAIERLSNKGKDDLSPAFAAPASTVSLMDNPLKIRGAGDEGRVSTLDVAKALNNFTKKQLPALKFGEAEPAEQVERAKSIADDEARYQLAQNNTGETWYTKDMATHDKILQDMRPELENPAKLSMFKMVEAVLSSGQKPYANFKSAVKAWDYYHENGEFPPTNPDTGMSWGPRGAVAYGNAIGIINRLIKEKGEQGASDWLLSDHTVKELREYNNAKRGGGGGGVAGKQDDVLPGVMVLGPKRGPFAQNLHGQASAFTSDMWVSRSWNRWMGTTETDPNSGEILTDHPRNAKERELIKQSFQETAKNLGLTTSALQAVLWYYEQGLYDVHGAAKESWSFSDAAKRASDEEFNSFNFGDEKK